jgi:hypothetical protein
MITIYGLYDPRVGSIRYIGKTVMPVRQRLRGHVYKARSGRTKTAVGDWIRSLLLECVRPETRTLDSANDENWQAVEREWIAKTSGLLNSNPGGNGAHSRRPFPEKYVRLLGKKPDEEVGTLVGLTREGVGYHRRKLGIAPYELNKSHSFDHRIGKDPHNKITLPKSALKRLGKVSDGVLAAEVGCSVSVIQGRRQALGIKPCLQKPHTGSSHGMSLLDEEKVHVIRAALGDGMSGVELSKQFGVSTHTISNIKTRRTWSHI